VEVITEKPLPDHQSKYIARNASQENSCKYLPFGEKIVKIGPVDTEIALLIVKKKEEIMEGKIYTPFVKFAERAK